MHIMKGVLDFISSSFLYSIDSLSMIRQEIYKFSSGFLSANTRRSEITINTGFKRILCVHIASLLDNVGIGYSMYEQAYLKTINDSSVILEFEYSGNSGGELGIEGDAIIVGI